MTTPLKKIITFATNYNNKLGQHEFIHVDFAPRKHVPLFLMEQYQVEIRTKDNSHPPVICQLHDIAIFTLGQLHPQHTMPSHGLTVNQFINQLLQQVPEISHETPMAAYYYRHTEAFFLAKSG